MSNLELKTLMDMYCAPGKLCAARDDHESADFGREHDRLKSELCDAERQVLPGWVNADDVALALFYAYAFSGVRAGRDESVSDVERHVRRVMEAK